MQRNPEYGLRALGLAECPRRGWLQKLAARLRADARLRQPQAHADRIASSFTRAARPRARARSCEVKAIGGGADMGTPLAEIADT